MHRELAFPRMGLRSVLWIAIVLMFAEPLAAQTNGILDATKAHAVVPHAPALNPGAAMTLEAWVRPSPQTKAFHAFIDKDYSTGFSFGLASNYPRTDSNIATLYLAGNHYTGPLVVTDSSTWTHVAVTVDTVTHQGVYYVNGTPSRSFSGSLYDSSVTLLPLMIGRSQCGDQFRGLIDEVRIWNVARTAGEIAGLWNHEARGNEPGLVAVYHFEDPRDTVAWNRATGGGLKGSLAPDARIVSIPWTQAFTDEHEPNGSYASATPMAYGSKFLTASIAPGDTDIYKIYTLPGEVFRVVTGPKTGADVLKLTVSIYGPDSSRHITTYLSGSSGFPALYSAASVPGYRYVRIRNDGGPSGSYTLTATYSQALPPDSCEPNDSKATATPRAWGTLTKATILPGIDGGVAVPDTDYYSITAVPGEIGVFLYSLQGVSCGSAFASFLDPSGAAITKTFPSYAANKLFTSGGTYYTKIRPNEAACYYVVGFFKGLADVRGMFYDPMTYGSNVCLMDGYNGAYDQAYDLKVNGTKFQALADYSQSEPGARQYVFGPATMSGLTVWRKFFVPSAAQGDSVGYCRIQEVLTNPTGSPITVTVGVLSNLGSDAETRALSTSSGDTLVTSADRWVVTDDKFSPGTDPALTSIIDGTGGADKLDSLSLNGDNLYWEWRNVTIPAGETRIYLYYVAQDTIPSSGLAKGPLFSGAILPSGAKLGLGSDAVRVMNWPTGALVSADSEEPLPLTFALEQNYPNPFNPATVVGCQLPAAGQVTLVVYDILGRQVAVLASGRFSAGRHTFPFDGSRLASGVYLCRLEVTSERSSFVAVRKMILMN